MSPLLALSRHTRSEPTFNRGALIEFVGRNWHEAYGAGIGKLPDRFCRAMVAIGTLRQFAPVPRMVAIGGTADNRRLWG
jgi:hypothetical protein